MMLYWLLRPWRCAFDFSGRATRREYWLFLVQLYGAAFALMMVAGMVSRTEAGAEAGIDLAALLVILVGIIPYLSASVRRLHDHDKSGWLFLLALIPLVGWIFFLIMMLTPGTQGENGYGEDPRERGLSGEAAAAIFS